MKNSRVDLNFLERDDHDLAGYKEITCHIILDVNMDLTRKSRYVAVRHLANTPMYIISASVVSCDIVRLSLLIAALNDLYILSGDI